MQERHTAQLLSPDTHAPWQATHGAGIAHLWHTLPCIVVSIETMEATERCGYSESLHVNLWLYPERLTVLSYSVVDIQGGMSLRI